jgi:hypothetical protein
MPDLNIPIPDLNARRDAVVKFKDMNDGTFAETVVDGGGQDGVQVTTNTTAVTGNFVAIQVLEDATFSALTETGATGQAMTGFVIPAGMTIFGRFTGYTLASGKVRAYL